MIYVPSRDQVQRQLLVARDALTIALKALGENSSYDHAYYPPGLATAATDHLLRLARLSARLESMLRELIGA